MEKALEKKRLITVMTDTYDNLKDGAINDFKNQYDASGVLDWDSCYNKTDKDLVVDMKPLQQTDNLTSQAPISEVIDISKV